ncbi:MAG: hypothetical protein WBN02_15195 [Sedimenticolaceae bacterium]
MFKSPLDPEMKQPMGLSGLKHEDHEGHDVHLGHLEKHIDEAG